MTDIDEAIDDVRDAAFFGSLLAIAVMWLFLRRLAATTIVALAIPISVIVTFAPMYVMDVSLNIMSLGGLALGVGMLVDNSIVVLEAIERVNRELGTTTVVITHNADIARMADRVIRLGDGRIVEASRNPERVPAAELSW